MDLGISCGIYNLSFPEPSSHRCHATPPHFHSGTGNSEGKRAAPLPLPRTIDPDEPIQALNPTPSAQARSAARPAKPHGRGADWMTPPTILVTRERRGVKMAAYETWNRRFCLRVALFAAAEC